MKYSFGRPSRVPDSFLETGGKIRDWIVQRRRVKFVRAGDDIHQDGRVLHVFSDWADLIEGGGKGDQAETRHSTISWL